MRKVREERTGWRDKRISDMHRKFGFNCPGWDFDFLFLEYDTGKAVAIVEYKHEWALPQEASHPNYQAMIDLGDRAEIPTFVCRYSDDFSEWRVVPLNVHAKKWLPNRTLMTQREWITFLYKMRGHIPPDKLWASLGVEI